MFKFLRAPGARLATIVLLLQATVYYSMSRTEFIPDTPPWSGFSRTVGEWTTVNESQIDPEIVAKLQPDDYIVWDYASPQSPRLPVTVFIGYFKTQRKGLAPHSPKACLPSAGWSPVSSDVRQLDVPGESVPVNHYVVEKQHAQLLVVYWYQQDKRAFANEYLAQLYAVPELFLHGRTDVAIVRLTMPIPEGKLLETSKLAMDFGRQLYPLIRKHIPSS
jgi:EpsI family protein